MSGRRGAVIFVYLGLLALVSLYAGAGAWVKADFEAFVQKVQSEIAGNQTVEVFYNGESFRSPQDARIALQESLVSTIYPWIFRIPSALALLITVVSFGCLGGVAGLLKMIVLEKIDPSLRVVAAVPFFGAIVGIMVHGMATLLPVALTVNESTLRPTTLLFLALFAGAFSDHAFNWLECNTKKIFDVK